MNTLTPKALLNKLRSKKKADGFTLVELMVVIVVVGILSAVALPGLNGTKARAYSSEAKQQVVQAAKACSIEVLGDGTLASANLNAVTSGDVTNDAATCAADATYAFTGGGTKWSVTLVEGIPSTPSKS